MRAAHHSELLELELARRKIPFVKYGGIRYLEAAHVKDFVALLRVATTRTTSSAGSDFLSYSMASVP
jgi:DNA helicase-2/ATP-dependent DNA helicase PcrA